MSTVAEQLLVAREAQSLTVHQVAEVTKIRTDHIRALEEGNFDVFSAPVYIKGFVRAYASMLKLNVQAVMADLDRELNGSEKFSEPSNLPKRRRGILDFLTLQLSKLNWRVALVGSGVIVLVLIIGAILLAVRHHQTSDPLANLPPAVYHSAQSGEVVPLPTPASHR